MTDATPAEIMRRLDDVVTKVAEVAAQMSRDRESATKLYLPRETYGADRRGDSYAREADKAAVAEVAKDVGRLESENKRNADFRRLASLGFAIAAITSLVTLSVALSNYLAR